MSRAVLCTPLRVEQAALRGAGRSMRVVHTGMGPRRAAATAAILSRNADPVLVAGVAGALAPHIRPGDVVVATEVRNGTVSALRFPNSTAGLFTRLRTALLWSSGAAELPARSAEVASAPLLAGALRRLGLTVHVGAISSVSRIGGGTAGSDALAVDMESAQLAAAGTPFAVIRAIVDTPDHPLWQLGTLHRGVTALRTLRACAPALELWAAATGPREVLLAAPRSFCAGVARAIDTVDRALQRYGAPVYVRRQIVHNAHVVGELQQRGAVFVDEVARELDLVLVVGSPNSSNSVRLVEAAQREGVPAYLVDDVAEIDLRWLVGTTRVGVTAGASAPPHLVEEIVHCLGGLGPVHATESRLIDEDVTFALPREVV
jgi:4-hydroxy-3-methylbut-2-enyl diphosphate reductase